MNLLQDRINELNSGILDIFNHEVHVTGFFNKDRLRSHLELNKDNWSSKGIYDKSELSFSRIKDNALFIVRENGNIISQHQFVTIHKDQGQYEEKSKIKTMMIKIRKSSTHDLWQVVTSKYLTEFKSKDELEKHLVDTFINKIEF